MQGGGPIFLDHRTARIYHRNIAAATDAAVAVESRYT